MEDLQKGLRVGDNVAIREVGGTEIRYYRIVNRDTIFLVDSHSAIAAGSTEDYTEYENLDPPSDQLYQIYQIQLVGNVDFYLKQPAATNRWGTNRSPTGGYLDDENDMALVNIWITQDYPPSVKLVNNTNVSVTAKLRWWGWRYQISELKDVVEVNGKLGMYKEVIKLVNNQQVKEKKFEHLVVTPISVGTIAR